MVYLFVMKANSFKKYEFEVCTIFFLIFHFYAPLIDNVYSKSLVGNSVPVDSPLTYLGPVAPSRDVFWIAG